MIEILQRSLPGIRSDQLKLFVSFWNGVLGGIAMGLATGVFFGMPLMPVRRQAMLQVADRECASNATSAVPAIASDGNRIDCEKNIGLVAYKRLRVRQVVKTIIEVGPKLARRFFASALFLAGFELSRRSFMQCVAERGSLGENGVSAGLLTVLRGWLLPPSETSRR